MLFFLQVHCQVQCDIPSVGGVQMQQGSQQSHQSSQQSQQMSQSQGQTQQVQQQIIHQQQQQQQQQSQSQSQQQPSQQQSQPPPPASATQHQPPSSSQQQQSQPAQSQQQVLFCFKSSGNVLIACGKGFKQKFFIKVTSHHAVESSGSSSNHMEEGLNCQEIKLTGQMVTSQEIKDENKEIACNVKDNRLIMAG